MKNIKQAKADILIITKKRLWKVPKLTGKWINDKIPELLLITGMVVINYATFRLYALAGLYLIGISAILMAWLVASSRRS